MATKKKTITAQPLDVPAVLHSEEWNKPVARAKAALAKKWSLTKAETLFDASDLAWFFLAVRYDDDARQLTSHIAERVRFGSDKNLWLPSSFSLALPAETSTAPAPPSPPEATIDIEACVYMSWQNCPSVFARATSRTPV